MIDISYIWIIAGMILIIVEIFTPTKFVFLSMGAGMLCAGLIAYSGASFFIQIIIFTVVCSVTLLLIRNFLKKREKKEIIFGAPGLIGKVGLVTRRIDGLHGGLVKIEGETWRAIEMENKIVDEGRSVRVENIEGTKLIVKEIENRKNKEDKG